MDQSPVSSVQLIDAQEESHSQPMPEDSSKCPLCSGGQIVHFMTAPDRFHWRRDAIRSDAVLLMLVCLAGGSAEAGRNGDPL